MYAGLGWDRLFATGTLLNAVRCIHFLLLYVLVMPARMDGYSMHGAWVTSLSTIVTTMTVIRCKLITAVRAQCSVMSKANWSTAAALSMQQATRTYIPTSLLLIEVAH